MFNKLVKTNFFNLNDEKAILLSFSLFIIATLTSVIPIPAIIINSFWLLAVFLFFCYLNETKNWVFVFFALVSPKEFPFGAGTLQSVPVFYLGILLFFFFYLLRATVSKASFPINNYNKKTFVCLIVVMIAFLIGSFNNDRFSIESLIKLILMFPIIFLICTISKVTILQLKPVLIFAGILLSIQVILQYYMVITDGLIHRLPYGDMVKYGGFLGATTGAFIVYSIVLIWSTQKFIFWLTPVLIIMFFALYLSGYRTWLFFASLLPCLSLILRLKLIIKNNIVLSVFGIFIFLLLGYFLFDMVFYHFNNFIDEYHKARFFKWKYVLQSIYKNIYWGVGFDGISVYYPGMIRQEGANSTDSLYLDLLLQLGIFGIMISLPSLSYLFKRIKQATKIVKKDSYSIYIFLISFYTMIIFAGFNYDFFGAGASGMATMFIVVSILLIDPEEFKNCYKIDTTCKGVREN